MWITIHCHCSYISSYLVLLKIIMNTLCHKLYIFYFFPLFYVSTIDRCNKQYGAQLKIIVKISLNFIYCRNVLLLETETLLVTSFKDWLNMLYICNSEILVFSTLHTEQNNRTFRYIMHFVYAVETGKVYYFSDSI